MKNKIKQGNYMKSLSKHLFVLWALIIFSCISSYCLANKKIKTAAEVVEEFCSNEFNRGTEYFEYNPPGEYRERMVKNTPERLEKIEKMKFTVEGNTRHAYSNYPMHIVDSYEIKKVEQIDNKHAYALIAYHQLVQAITEKSKIKVSCTRFIEPICDTPIKDDRYITEKLNLEYDGKQWWIVDPLYPKVSYKAVLNYYSRRVNNTHLRLTGKKPGDINKHMDEYISALFQEIYNYDKQLLDFLLNLRG